MNIHIEQNRGGADVNIQERTDETRVMKSIIDCSSVLPFVSAFPRLPPNIDYSSYHALLPLLFCTLLTILGTVPDLLRAVSPRILC
jgi:hypothetical protein